MLLISDKYNAPTIATKHDRLSNLSNRFESIHLDMYSPLVKSGALSKNPSDLLFTATDWKMQLYIELNKSSTPDLGKIWAEHKELCVGSIG